MPLSLRKMARANPSRVGAIVGDLAAVEEIFALKDLMTRLGVANLDCRQDGSALDPKWGRASYLFNSTIAGIDTGRRAADCRRQSAHAKRRCSMRASASAGAARESFPIGLIGAKAPLTYTYDYLGAGPETLADIGRHGFADAMRKAEHPLVIVGADAFARPDGACGRVTRCQSGHRSRRGQGRLERLLASCTARHRASARSISVLCRATAA